MVVPEARASAARPGPTLVTRCLTWSEGSRRAGLRCYTAAGHPIKCCGHGLLCSAWHWLHHWNGEGVLTTCDSDIPCRLEDGVTWVGFPALFAEPCPVPGWVPVVLAGQPATRCARAGPEDGYLIIELAANTDLTTIIAPDATLAAWTRRALIVTCRVDSETALYDEHFHFRYFAPQYGVAEDNATGSAMRILARHWRDLGDELAALQRSPAGGYLRSRLDRGGVWVGGTVSPDNNGATVYG